MNSNPMPTDALAKTVIAVPPVARDYELRWNKTENEKVIRYLEAGGVKTLLYGGNAALAHVAISEYDPLLKMLIETATEETTVIPSVGPQFGMMMDQAEILADYPFPTVMLLPSRDAVTAAGLALGIRKFVEKLGKPIVLYIKHDGMIDIETVQKLNADGLISWIKYAIVREDPQHDPFLQGLVDTIGPNQIVSGMGEQPAITHLRQFGLASFTSGCVCIAPALSMRMLQALQQQDDALAEQIRQMFAPLEALRDGINPVRVLHAAVKLAEIAETGPITPFWSPVTEVQAAEIKGATRVLLKNAEHYAGVAR